jgi:hypothetical protein
MSDGTLTDERLREIVLEAETIGVAALSHDELVILARSLLIERAKVERLEDIVSAQDEVIRDEREDHKLFRIKVETGEW